MTYIIGVSVFLRGVMRFHRKKRLIRSLLYYCHSFIYIIIYISVMVFVELSSRKSMIKMLT